MPNSFEQTRKELEQLEQEMLETYNPWKGFEKVTETVILEGDTVKIIPPQKETQCAGIEVFMTRTSDGFRPFHARLNA